MGYRLLALLWLICLTWVYGTDVELDKYFQGKFNTVMKSEREALLQDMGFSGRRLIVVKSDRSALRYAVNSNPPLGYTCSFLGWQVTEMVFSFNSKGLLTELRLSMYNRGDCGNWEFTRFRKLVRELREGLTKLSRVNEREASSRELNGVSINERSWVGRGGTDAVLRWSGKGENLEYVTVILVPHGKAGTGSLTKELKTVTDLRDLPRRVKREKDGTRWLDIPMEDQGNKGYCMAATFARILKYYRAKVDMHVIAQLLDTDPSKGTNYRSGIEAMLQNKKRFDVNVKELFKDDKLDTQEGTRHYLEIYNRLARKRKKPVIREEAIFGTGKWPITVFYEMSDKKLFTQCRNTDPTAAKKLMSIVKSHIDRGIPLMWLIPGHARLINGYKGSGTIVYSDSWGAGHERKTMSIQEALALTYEVYAVTPM